MKWRRFLSVSLTRVCPRMVAGKEAMSFSLVADDRSLDLECDTEETQDMWASAFEWLLMDKAAIKEP